MIPVIVEARSPATPKVLQKLFALQELPIQGFAFHLRDTALDGLVYAEEVAPPDGDRLASVVIHVDDLCLNRMGSSAWSEEPHAA